MSEVKTVSMRYDKYIEMKEKAEKYPALVEKLKEFVFEIGDLSDAIIKVIEERDTAIEDINSYLHIHGACPFCALYEQRSWLKANGKDCRKKDCGRWRGVKKKMYVWKSEGDKLSCVPVTYDNILELVWPVTLSNGDLRFPFIITDDPEGFKKEVKKALYEVHEGTAATGSSKEEDEKC